jgi:hypothetical protein
VELLTNLDRREDQDLEEQEQRVFAAYAHSHGIQLPSPPLDTVALALALFEEDVDIISVNTLPVLDDDYNTNGSHPSMPSLTFQPQDESSSEETTYATSERTDLFPSSAESTIASVLEAVDSIFDNANPPPAFSPRSSPSNYSPITADNMSISTNPITFPTENVTFVAHPTENFTTDWRLHLGETSPA